MATTSDVLDILQGVHFDDSISHMEWHTHMPYASNTLDNNDEIRIPIQQQDICVLPSSSYIYLEGKLVKESGEGVPAGVKIVNNGFAYLFDEVRYELNTVEVDRVRNPGITTTLKGYVSLSEGDLKSMTNAGWITSSKDIGNRDESLALDSKGNFGVCIPLARLLGFAEDYRKVMVNARHELVLIRGSNDKNAVRFTSTDTPPKEVEPFKINLSKVCWRIPYVTLSDRQKISLLKHLDRGISVPVAYRSWELYEYPLLPKTTKQSWSVKTATQLEKPRYVIVAFQTARKNNTSRNMAHFDGCKITNVKLHLNSISYPYDDLKVDFDKNHLAVLYDMYTRFQESYYNTVAQPLFTRDEFAKYLPIVVIDCSKQNESIKTAPVDIRLELETGEDFADNTCAYCLILHDKAISYDPSTGLVRKLV